MSRFALLALLILAACPGPDTDEQTTPVVQRLAGDWAVDVEVSATGAFWTYTGRLVIAADGDNLTATAICPDGSGELTAAAMEYEVPWTGVIDCPVAVSDCSDAWMRLRDGSFWIENGTELVAALNGALLGCGNERPLVIRYHGRK